MAMSVAPGGVRHRNFAMGVGELNKDQFTRFLVDTLGRAAARCRDGAIAYVFMDWRHMGELLNAGEQVFSELKNLCIWNKTNGGMGTFYRSKLKKVNLTPQQPGLRRGLLGSRCRSECCTSSML
jgi:hypothetical protein